MHTADGANSPCETSLAKLRHLLEQSIGPADQMRGGHPRDWAINGLLCDVRLCPDGGTYLLLGTPDVLCSVHSKEDGKPAQVVLVVRSLVGKSIGNKRATCYQHQELVVAGSNDKNACPAGGTIELRDGLPICSVHGQADPQPLYAPGVPRIVHLPRVWLSRFVDQP
jgi:hypothetical protein